MIRSIARRLAGRQGEETAILAAKAIRGVALGMERGGAPANETPIYDKESLLKKVTDLLEGRKNCIRPHHALGNKTPLQFLKDNGIIHDYKPLS